MKIQGIPWAGLWVRDVDATVAFYRDILGLPELERGAGYVHLDAGNDTFLTVSAAPAENPEVTGRPQQHTWEVSFAVADVDEAIDELAGKRLRLTPKHIGRWRDQRWIRFRDPEGNLIALKEERPQRVPSKSELLEKLQSSEAEALDRLRAVPRERFEQIVSSEGWTGQQALACIAAVERGPARLVESERQRLAGAPEPPARPGTADGYIRHQLYRRAEAPVGALIDEFQTNRAATIAAVEQADAALLGTMISQPITAPLATVVYALAVEQMLGYVGEIAGVDYLPWRSRNIAS